MIMLSNEKDIMSHEEMVRALEDIEDQSTILETPNLVIIPYD